MHRAAVPPHRAHPFDQPLPAELTGRHHNGFTRYRTDPVFSRPWVLGRWRPWGPAWALAMLFPAGGVAMAPAPEQAWSMLVAVFLVVLALLATAQHLGATEPLKQWLAEHTGMVGASGKHRRPLMSLGVSIQAETPAPATAASANGGKRPAVNATDGSQTAVWAAPASWSTGWWTACAPASSGCAATVSPKSRWTASWRS